MHRQRDFVTMLEQRFRNQRHHVQPERIQIHKHSHLEGRMNTVRPHRHVDFRFVVGARVSVEDGASQETLMRARNRVARMLLRELNKDVVDRMHNLADDMHAAYGPNNEFVKRLDKEIEFMMGGNVDFEA